MGPCELPLAIRENIGVNLGVFTLYSFAPHEIYETGLFFENFRKQQGCSFLNKGIPFLFLND